MTKIKRNPSQTQFQVFEKTQKQTKIEEILHKQTFETLQKHKNRRDPSQMNFQGFEKTQTQAKIEQILHK